MGQILSKVSSDITSTNSVELIILGLDYKQFIKFKDFLKQYIGSIKAIYQRTFLEKRADIEVDVKGSAQSLSEELALQDFKEFKIAIIDFSENKLTLKVDKK